jgi:hypothetical protein
MARKKTETVTEASKRPDFSLRMTDKDLYFGVEVYGDKLVVDGTNVSQIKTQADLERYVSLVTEVSERVEMEVMSDVCSSFGHINCDGTCGETYEESFCGPCYCGN